MPKLSARLGNRVFLGVILLLYSGCLILGSCDSISSPMRHESEGSGEMSVTIRLSKAAAADISRAEVVVEGTGMTEIRQNLTISGNTITGTVHGIPAGSNRLFTLNGYDASGDLTYTGSANATVVAGQQVTVRITVTATSSVGSPQLEVSGTASALRPTYEGTTIITGEIMNAGSADATSVALDLRARNSSGTAIGDARVSVGTIRKGESKLFSASFSQTCYDDNQFANCHTRHISRADFTLSYSEGDPVTGRITVQ